MLQGCWNVFCCRWIERNKSFPIIYITFQLLHKFAIFTYTSNFSLFLHFQCHNFKCRSFFLKKHPRPGIVNSKFIQTKHFQPKKRSLIPNPFRPISSLNGPHPFPLQTVANNTHRRGFVVGQSIAQLIESLPRHLDFLIRILGSVNWSKN
jgi:hypothetical protein